MRVNIVTMTNNDSRTNEIRQMRSDMELFQTREQNRKGREKPPKLCDQGRRYACWTNFFYRQTRIHWIFWCVCNYYDFNNVNQSKVLLQLLPLGRSLNFSGLDTMTLVRGSGIVPIDCMILSVWPGHDFPIHLNTNVCAICHRLVVVSTRTLCGQRGKLVRS